MFEFIKPRRQAKATPIERIPLSKLFSSSSNYDLTLLLIASSCSILNGLAQPIISVLFAEVVGYFPQYYLNRVEDKDIASQILQSQVNYLCIILFGIGFGVAVAAYLQVSLFMIYGERRMMQLRAQYYKSLLSQEVGYFDQSNPSLISSQITSDLNLIQEGLAEKCGFLIQFTSTFVAGFGLAFYKGWKLTLVLVAVTPILMVAGNLCQKVIAERTVFGQKAYGEAGLVAEESLAAIKTVFSCNAQGYELNRYDVKLKEALKVGHGKAIVIGICFGIIMTTVYLFYAVGFYYGSNLVLLEGYGTENVLGPLLCTLIGSLAIGEAFPFFTAIASAQAAAHNLFQIIERESKINPFTVTPPHLITLPPLDAQEVLEFQDVHFSYPSRTKDLVLKGVGFKVQMGQKVALVGSSGSGKSTCISLLERFYDPNQGKISFNQIDIRDIDARYLRKQIGLVSQEPTLFHSSIRNNILLGLDEDHQLTDSQLDAKLEEVCKMCNIYHFIQSLPQKYDTIVGEKGSKLSGGQKQRIAIARAIINDPKILLLDEATSALDSQSERIVQQALDLASLNRTTIVVAHKLTTIKDADQILVFDNGVIIESGNHTQLMDLEGKYYDLVTSQSLRNSDQQTDSLKENVDLKQELNVQLESIEKQDPLEVIVSNSDVIDRTPSIKYPLLRVIQLTFRWKFLFGLGMLGALLQGATLPYYSYLFTQVTESLNQILMPDTQQLGKTNADFWCLMFVILAVINFLFAFIRQGVLSYLGENLSYYLRLKCFETILTQDVEYFDSMDNSTGLLCARLATDCDSVTSLISKALGPLTYGISATVIGFILAFSYGWKLALVVSVTIPILAYGQLCQIKVITQISTVSKKCYEQVSEITTESITNIRTLTSLNQQNHFYNQCINRIQSAHQSTKKGALKLALAYGLSSSAEFFLYAVGFWYGTSLVLKDEYTFVQLFQVVAATLFSSSALGVLGSKLSAFAKAKVAAIEIFKLLDSQPKINSLKQVGKLDFTMDGDVRFDEVCFSYPTRKDIRVVNHLNLNVLHGKKVALVGGSGSGKSTVFSLLQRFYDSDWGKLTIGTNDITELNLPKLRESMSIVSQEPVLFNLTISENISYGLPNITQHQIETVAKLANAHTFITQFQHQYQTKCGQGGNQLSGGQKQRIAIARALLRNPKLLLLDEATSALDSQSERIVQEALDQAILNRTTITIAHRLSTIQNYDTILVLKQGRVVELGTHDHLYNLKGYYYSLVQQQNFEN